MIMGDPLVAVIFEAIKKEKANSSDRRLAVVRAGLIAQIYADDQLLMDEIFGSFDNKLHHNDDLIWEAGEALLTVELIMMGFHPIFAISVIF